MEKLSNKKFSSNLEKCKLGVHLKYELHNQAKIGNSIYKKKIFKHYQFKELENKKVSDPISGDIMPELIRI